MTCIAKTKKGFPCKNEATSGSDYCRIHAKLADKRGVDLVATSVEGDVGPHLISQERDSLNRERETLEIEKSSISVEKDKLELDRERFRFERDQCESTKRNGRWSGVVLSPAWATLFVALIGFGGGWVTMLAQAKEQHLIEVKRFEAGLMRDVIHDNSREEAVKWLQLLMDTKIITMAALELQPYIADVKRLPSPPTLSFIEVLNRVVAVLEEINVTPGLGIGPSWTLEGKASDRPPGLGFQGPGINVLRLRINQQFQSDGVNLTLAQVQECKTVEELADTIFNHQEMLP